MGYKTINERGADKARLLNWLIQPKQGVKKELADLGIKAFEQNLQNGIEPHKTSIPFRKHFSKIVHDPKFPESFWIDNYILFWCRRTEKRLVSDKSTEILGELTNKRAEDKRVSALLFVLIPLTIINLVNILWIL